MPEKLHRKYRYILTSRRAAWIGFLLPSLVGVSVFVLLPFADVGRRSFTTAVTGKFCGLVNYQTVFANEAFLLAVKNTLRFVCVGVPLLLVLSLLLSAAIHGLAWEHGLKSAFLFPIAVPTATVVLVWRMLFHQQGLCNAFLSRFGLHPVDWLGSGASFWVLVFSYLWKNLGYTIVLWLAGLSQIPEEYQEAARVDGASRAKCFWYVVLPGLKPVLYTVTVLSFLNSFRVFREVYLVAGAYPQEKIYLLQHLFQNWFTSLEVDKMAAAAVCVTIVFTLVQLALQWIWEGKEERSGGI